MRQLKLMKSTTLFSALLFAGGLTAHAQVEGEPEPEARQDTVIITGSRIARDPNLDSPVPVQSLNAEDLLNSGDFNITETINDVPALLTSTTSEQSVQTTAADGTNVLNLRGLGSERTLVLVNGRRHVSGVEGSQAVDIGSIPTALVERVDVVTGGNSAVYGADAVTGVVNFVLKTDYEGLEFDLSTGLSDDGDASQYRGYVLAGKNFNDGRGNVTLNVELSKDDGLREGDRDFTANGATANDYSNPLRRFQQGDITDATPNFSQFYNFANTGYYNYGEPIPSADAFSSLFADAFGSAPTLTAAELSLIEQAASAYPRAILPFPTFSITSAGGVVSPGDFSLAQGFDLDGNGTDDCLDSYVGYNNSFDGANSFGLAGGCWNILDAQSNFEPVVDGLVASAFNQFGGSGIMPTNTAHIIGEEDKIAINLNATYEVDPAAIFFGEAKVVKQSITTGSSYNSFWDLVYISPENPFIPAGLDDVADATDGLYITRDHNDLGDNQDTLTRTTQRYVAGLQGTFNSDWSYELSVNYGEFELETLDRDVTYMDRLFAATDAVLDEEGNIVCRADTGDIDYPTTIFAIPPWNGGVYTFNPGSGECVPFNVFGVGAPSQEAVDWITTDVKDVETITQTIYSAGFVGDTSDWFELPGGPIGFAAGLEYREETSEATYDPLRLGILPQEGIGPDGTVYPAGTLLRDIDPDVSSLVWRPNTTLNNPEGSYDTFDYYVEASAPIFTEVPGFYSLIVDAAVRQADYSTIGSATTWKVGGSWAPVPDLTFRAVQSEAIRAPNIFELFSPDQGQTFRPVDPCDLNEIPTAPDPTVRAANCAALGLPADFVDPLSASFLGVVGGNSELEEETATTFTAGFVLQPRFLEGFSLSIDYWDIEIENAIDSVSAQDIVDLCVDSASIENQYCALIERNDDPNSAQFGGFTFLRQSQVNLGRLEASGVDFSAAYGFSIGENDFNLALNGSKMEKLDEFFDPSDASFVNPELKELQRPELSGMASIGYARGPLALNWSTRYQSEQLLRGAEIETYLDTFGPSVMMDPVYIHDLSGSYELDNGISFRGGVNNVTEEEPFITEYSWPTGARGRYFFVGINAKL